MIKVLFKKAKHLTNNQKFKNNFVMFIYKKNREKYTILVTCFEGPQFVKYALKMFYVISENLYIKMYYLKGYFSMHLFKTLDRTQLQKCLNRINTFEF